MEELIWYTEEGLEYARFKGHVKKGNLFTGSGVLSLFGGETIEELTGKWQESILSLHSVFSRKNRILFHIY